MKMSNKYKLDTKKLEVKLQVNQELIIHSVISAAIVSEIIKYIVTYDVVKQCGLIGDVVFTSSHYLQKVVWLFIILLCLVMHVVSFWPIRLNTITIYLNQKEYQELLTILYKSAQYLTQALLVLMNEQYSSQDHHILTSTICLLPFQSLSTCEKHYSEL